LFRSSAFPLGRPICRVTLDCWFVPISTSPKLWFWEINRLLLSRQLQKWDSKHWSVADLTLPTFIDTDGPICHPPECQHDQRVNLWSPKYPIFWLLSLVHTRRFILSLIELSSLITVHVMSLRVPGSLVEWHWKRPLTFDYPGDHVVFTRELLYGQWHLPRVFEPLDSFRCYHLK